MTRLTLTETLRALRAGRLSAGEVVSEAIKRADRNDAVLGAFVRRCPEQALAVAADADRRRARGDARLLEGIPIGVKDNIATVEGPTSAQSRVRRAQSGNRGDAPLVGRLRSAGAVMMGTLSMMEFAFGLPDVGEAGRFPGTDGGPAGGRASGDGPTIDSRAAEAVASGQETAAGSNAASRRLPIPRSAMAPQHWAGGSSSGSGSAVAADFVLGALGTDTAGSIRIPAAYNAVTGLKPTYGRLDKAGVVPLARSLDTVGPLARSAADCGLLLAALEGDRERAEEWIAGRQERLAGLKIGYDDLDRHATLTDPGQPGRIREAVDLLRSAGARIIPVRLPLWELMTAVDVVICYRESYAYHRRMLTEQWHGYGRGARIVLAAGSVVTWEDYCLAQRVRRHGQAELAALFDEVDVVVTPTSHLGPPLLASIDVLNPLDALPSLHTLYWNAQGNPTVALPIGPGDAGTPLSVSISGPMGADDLVLRVGAALQDDTDWHRRPPAEMSVVSASPVHHQQHGVEATPVTVEDRRSRQDVLLPHAQVQSALVVDPAELEAVERVQVAIRRHAALLRT